MSERIIINNLRVEAFLGVYEWEQQVRQVVYLDLEILPLGRSFREIADSDRLEDALDYSRLVQHIEVFVVSHRFRLLETMISTLADMLLAEFAIAELALNIHKPSALKGNAVVSAQLLRYREHGSR